jgi:hypothetical protein
MITLAGVVLAATFSVLIALPLVSLLQIGFVWPSASCSTR